MNKSRRSSGMTALTAMLFILGILLIAAPVSTPAMGQALSGLDTDGGKPAATDSAASSAPQTTVAPAVSQAPQAPATFTGYVSAKIGLKVRKGPWGTQVGLLAFETRVTVIGTEGDWYHINYGGAKRYIHSNYVTRSGPAPTESAGGNSSAASFTGYVTAGTLNVRTAPWGSKVTTYSRGTSVKVTGKSGEWYKIDASGKTLFVHSSYISKEKPSSGGSTGGSDSGGGTIPSTTPGANSGNVRNPQKAEFTTGTPNQRILSGMKSIIDKYLEYPAACGKHYDGSPATRGNLGCAFAVSMGLQRAGYNVYSLGVDDLSNQLMRKGFTKVAVGQRKAGDVVVWNPSHIGIIAESGRAVSNSSSLSKVTEHTDRASSTRFILRPPA